MGDDTAGESPAKRERTALDSDDNSPLEQAVDQVREETETPRKSSDATDEVIETKQDDIRAVDDAATVGNNTVWCDSSNTSVPEGEKVELEVQTTEQVESLPSINAVTKDEPNNAVTQEPINATEIAEEKQEDKETVPLYCKNCKAQICDSTILCWYTQVDNSQNAALKDTVAPLKHLMIRPELTATTATANGADPESVLPRSVLVEPQVVKNKASMSRWEVQCRGCRKRIGRDLCMGPRREYVWCFGAGETLLGRDALTQVATASLRPSSRRTWGQISTQVREGLLIPDRNFYTFYGVAADNPTRAIDQLGNLSGLTVTRPTLEYLQENAQLTRFVRDRPRPYQIEAALVAVTTPAPLNVIVYMPTGAGKTMMSILACSVMKAVNPHKTVVFVVHRVPLVFQQGQAFQQSTNLDVLMVSGQASNNPRGRQISTFDVIVCTAGILFNWLSSGTLRMEHICCLVFDEVHNATGQHLYSQIMRGFFQPCSQPLRPLLIGLTASPGNGADVVYGVRDMHELCTLCSAIIYTPVVYRDEMMAAVSRPALMYRIVKSLQEEADFLRVVRDYCQSTLTRRLQPIILSSSSTASNSNSTQEDFLTLPEGDYPMIRGFLRRLLDAVDQKLDRVGHAIVSHLGMVCTAFELCSVVGVRAAATYLQRLFESVLKTVQSAEHNPYDALRADVWIASDLTVLEGIRDHMQTIATASDGYSPRLTELILTLSDSDIQGDTRAIVFVQTKNTARWLNEVLCEEKHGVIARWGKPAVFTGATPGGADSMSWEENQQPILDGFRTGSIKLLVSTNVLQEGIDVSACNMIILFDRTWSLTSFVQSRGRARAAKSQYIVICEDAERLYYENLIASERNVESIVLGSLQKNSPLCNARLLRVILECKLASQALPNSAWPGRHQVEQVMHRRGGLASGSSSKANVTAVNCILHDVPRSFVISADSKRQLCNKLSDIPLLDDATVAETTRTVGATIEVTSVEAFTDSRPLLPGDLTHDLILECKVRSPLKNASLLDSASFSWVQKAATKIGCYPGPTEKKVSFTLNSPSFRASVSAYARTEMCTAVHFGGMTVTPGAAEDLFLATHAYTERPAAFAINYSERTFSVMLPTNITAPGAPGITVFRWDLSGGIDTAIFVNACFTTGHTQIILPLLRPSSVWLDDAERWTDSLLITGRWITAVTNGGLGKMSRICLPPAFQAFSSVCILCKQKGSEQQGMLNALLALQAQGKVMRFSESLAQCHPIPSINADAIESVFAGRPFEVNYAVRSFLTRTFSSTSGRITEQFLGRLSVLDDRMMLDVLPILERRLRTYRFADLQQQLNESVVELTTQEPADVDMKPAANPNDRNRSIPVRFVAWTPARVMYLAPKSMPCNRVLRAYNPDYFIRVQFRDDDQQRRLSSAASEGSIDRLLEAAHDFLHSGLVVGGRHYKFLAMSSSQLRDHGCWFVAEHYVPVARINLLQESLADYDTGYPGWEEEDSQQNVEWTLVTADSIRASLGDFTDIKNVAKYVARLGQSLSASQDTVEVDQRHYSEIPDVTVKGFVPELGTTEQYNFTDGIGMVSPALAREIAANDKISDPDFAPTVVSEGRGDMIRSAKYIGTKVYSAYQIRFAGYKGVIAINPNCVPNGITDHPPPARGADLERTRYIWLRDSMNKFESVHRRLEVLNRSEYIACHLNRQVIVIMSSLGVPDASFSNLQDLMLSEMAGMLIESDAAARALASNYHMHPKINFTKAARQFGFIVEPFFRSILQSTYRRKMMELRTRSRVFVPKGRILMGVIDETGTLRENEVFIQVTRVIHDPLPTTHADWDGTCPEGYTLLSETADSPRMTVVGSVAIAKNPCMHPGDLRVLNAVQSHRLQPYMFDCMVFPCCGPRPITNMCSGSDLDGDLYFVVWDPTLVPDRARLVEPMPFATSKAKTVDDVQLEHIEEFFVNFMANDQLGKIANAHVVLADKSPLGVQDVGCKEMAKLFSCAVDFPKTGIVATLPQDLRSGGGSYPDFMDRPASVSYRSKKIIGRMYRKIRSIHSVAFLKTLAQGMDVSSGAAGLIVNQNMLVSGYERFLAQARAMYRGYAGELQRTLLEYDLHCEADLIAGNSEASMLGAGTLSRDDDRDALKVATASLLEMQARLRQQVFEMFGFTHAAEEEHEDFNVRRHLASFPDIAPFVSACYATTYLEPLKPDGLTACILGFPWIWADVLLHIYTGALTHRTVLYDGSYTITMSRDIATAFVGELGKDDLQVAALNRYTYGANLAGYIRSKFDVPVTFVGSSSCWLFSGTDDINLLIPIDASSAAMVTGIVAHLKTTYKHASVSAAGNAITYRGAPYNFSIVFDAARQKAKRAVWLRRLFMRRPEMLALARVVLKWTLSHRLLQPRMTSATTFMYEVLRYLLSQYDSEFLAAFDVECEEEAAAAVSSEWISKTLEDMETWDVLLKSFMDQYWTSTALVAANNIGFMLLHFFKDFAFMPHDRINDLLLESTVPVEGTGSFAGDLARQAFKSYNVLAQTLALLPVITAEYTEQDETRYDDDLDARALIDSNSGGGDGVTGSGKDKNEERQQASVKLLQKYGSEALFVEDASIVLFEDSVSSADNVEFKLYHGIRRPNHRNMNCYAGSIIEATRSIKDFSSAAMDVDADPAAMDVDDDMQGAPRRSHCFVQFFTHTLRQLTMAKQYGTPSWGRMKIYIKPGSSYFTHLPRAFTEEFMAATIERVQDALSMGYRSLDTEQTGSFLSNDATELQLLNGDALADMSDPTGTKRTASEDKQTVEPAERNFQELLDACDGEDSKGNGGGKPPVPRKKRGLTSMTSSFEPSLPLYLCDSEASTLRAFLERYKFAREEDRSGFAVSMAVYDARNKVSRGARFVLDDRARLARVMTSPIRWLLLDVIRGVQSADKLDVRVALSSSKTLFRDEAVDVASAEYKHKMDDEEIAALHDLTDIFGADLAKAAADGILHVEARPDGSRAVRLHEACRENPLVFTRYGRAERFKPSPQTHALLFSAHSGLASDLSDAIDATMLDRLKVVLTYATEYSECDPVTGVYGRSEDKIETEVHVEVDWTDLTSVAGRVRLAKAMWVLSDLVKRFYSKQE